ncbi:MAG: Gfo/Idh/MocA family oxidoreductase [Bacteriovoracaceae bacterium]
MKKVKVASVGYGHLGRWHAQKADQLENCELVAIVEPYQANKDKAQEAFPKVKVVNDIEEVLDSIDAAVVAAPTSLHHQLVKFLLENGKHVFCEKPLCSTLKEAQELKAHLNDNLVLQVGHSERCHQAWEILADEFDAIKGPATLKIERVAAFKGRATDVDVVQDLMIHDLDLALYLLKKKVKSVKAYGHKIRTGKWDQVNAILNFEDGSMAIIASGRNHVHEVRSLEITHDGGCLFVDLLRNKISVANDSQFDDGSFVKEREYEKRDHLLLEQNHFYESILQSKPAMVGYEDGVNAIKLVQAVIDSLETGKRVEI